MRSKKAAFVGAFLLCTVASVWADACTPDVGDESAPRFVEFEFDPTSGKTSQPTSLVMNDETGLIDLSKGGITVPAASEDCAAQQALSLAQCEFYQYLERLDGFPTLVPATTPTSAAIDQASATAPDNVFVYDLTRDETVEDLDISYDAGAGGLRIDPRTGFAPSTSYLVGVRGYRHGVEGERGAEGVASILYVLLKRDRSLTCGAESAGAIDARCENYALLANDPRFARMNPGARQRAIASNLLELEQLRRYYRGETPASPLDVWGTLARAAAMAKADVAIAWLFPIHSGSVVELDPKRGLTPQISAPNELRLALKGTLDPATLSAFSLANSAGTVFLLDVDVLQQNPLDPRALPPFEPSYADGEIVLTANDPDNGFIAGDTYALLLTDELTDTRGKPIVASPATVLLRSRGALIDADGKSQVAGFGDADAAALEQGRAQFAALLDDPTIKAATVSAARPEGLTRERITYLFGFEWRNP